MTPIRLLRSWLCTAALCATLVAAPASAQGTSIPPGDSPAAQQTRQWRSIEAQVEQIRGLQPLAEPDLRFLNRQSMHTYLADSFQRDYFPSERESDQKELVALGLIAPTDDIVQIQLDLLSDQVIGAYDSDAKSLFVLADQGAAGPVERMTYAHEFNHALQDQHYDLNTIAPKHADTNDHSLAVHALIEGDAVMLQTLWATATLSHDELVELTRTTSDSTEGLARVPLIVRTELLFPYIDGVRFVQQIYRQSGNSYESVDQLFHNPPESTAQVLHPDKYRDQVHPVAVRLPALTAALGPGWRQVGSGVLGELDTRVLLEAWGTSHDDAAHVAAGWRGDQWQLVENDGRSAIVVRSTWDSPSAAREFFSSYAHGLSARFNSGAVEESSSTRQALTTELAATDLQLQGSDVLAVIAFDRDSASAIVDAVTSSGL